MAPVFTGILTGIGNALGNVIPVIVDVVSSLLAAWQMVFNGDVKWCWRGGQPNKQAFLQPIGKVLTTALSAMGGAIQAVMPFLGCFSSSGGINIRGAQSGIRPNLPKCLRN